MGRVQSVSEVLAAFPVSTNSHTLLGTLQSGRGLGEGREGGGVEEGIGREGRGFLAEPQAVTVRKDSSTVFTEAPLPRLERDFYLLVYWESRRQDKVTSWEAKKDALSE